jgi:hypothetical protein
MIDEDIESQITPFIENNQDRHNYKQKISIFQKIKNIKKYNQFEYCDWVIGTILIVCVIATIIIITINETK